MENDPVNFTDPSGLDRIDRINYLEAPDGGIMWSGGGGGGCVIDGFAADPLLCRGPGLVRSPGPSVQFTEDGRIVLVGANASGVQYSLISAAIGQGESNGGSVPQVSCTIDFGAEPISGCVSSSTGSSGNTGSGSTANSRPAWAGSVNVPIKPFLNIMVPFAWVPNTEQACIGIGLAVGGFGINVGPLLWGSTSEADKVVSGFGWSAVGQMGPGVQYLQSGAASVGGPTFGTQGASIGYSVSACFP